MKKIIIVGAASGMGRELAKIFFAGGYTLGLADINTAQLSILARELGGDLKTKNIDVSSYAMARNQLEELITELNGVDIFIYTAGLADKTRIWKNECMLHQVNAIGFAALCSFVYDHWRANNKKGHIVGVTSILAVRGIRQAIAYCASKSFMKIYMQGLRQDAASCRYGIDITEIRPGYIDTPMTAGNTNIFWTIPAENAARLIVKAIMKKSKVAYVPGIWRLAALILKMLPEFLFKIRISSFKNYFSRRIAPGYEGNI